MATTSKTPHGSLIGHRNGPVFCCPQRTCLTPSRLTEPNTSTAMAIGWATTKTATERMHVPAPGAIQPTTDLAVSIAMVTAIPTQRQIGLAPRIATVPMPSPTTPHSGVMKTTMASVATPTATTPTIAQTAPVPQPLTVWAAPIETVTATRTQATRSPTMPPNGRTETVTTVAITPTATTPTPSQTIPANGRTAMVMVTATTPVATTAMRSPLTQRNGAMKTVMATATTKTEPKGTFARLNTVNPRNLQAEAVLTLTWMVSPTTWINSRATPSSGPILMATATATTPMFPAGTIVWMSLASPSKRAVRAAQMPI